MKDPAVISAGQTPHCDTVPFPNLQILPRTKDIMQKFGNLASLLGKCFSLSLSHSFSLPLSSVMDEVSLDLTERMNAAAEEKHKIPNLFLHVFRECQGNRGL